MNENTGSIGGSQAGAYVRAGATARGGTTTQESAGMSDGLSREESGLWYLDQAFPDAPSRYHLHVVHQVIGAADADVVEACLAHWVRRHEILRTAFLVEAGVPRRAVLAPWRPQLLRIAVDDDAEAEASVLELSQPRFDLSSGQLLRAAWVELGDGSAWLALVVHHLVCDEQSVALLMRELGSLYGALAAGQPIRLAPPGSVDHGARGRGREALPPHAAEYWRARLGSLPRLQLPGELVAPAVRSFPACEVRGRIGGTVAEALRARLRAARATPFMGLLAALQVVLSRFAGQQDVVIGTPISSRDDESLECALGLFVETMPIRVRVPPRIGATELLRVVRQAVLGAIEHRTSLHDLAELLQPQRLAYENPFCRVLFVFDSAQPTTALGEATLHARPVGSHVAKADLTVVVRELHDGLECLWQYDAEVLPRALVVAMAADLTRVAEALALGAESLHVPPSAGDAAWLDALATVRAPAPAVPSIVQRFAEVAAREPDADAVVVGERRLSYAALLQRADAVAAALAHAGVRRGDRVGLMLPRSLEVVVAALGVLRCGAAFVPLQLRSPAGWLSRVVADAELAAVVEVDGLGAALPASLPRIDVTRCEAGQAPASTPAGPDDVACVMYTSGTTGAPKGVLVPNRAVLRLVCDSAQLRFDTATRTAFIANPAFDALSFDLWGALLHGGAVVVPDGDDLLLEPRRFAAWLAQQRIDTLLLPVGLFNETARAVPTAFASLRLLLVGGEEPSPRWVRAVLEAGPPAAFFNAYGPTENGTITTLHRIALEDTAARIPLGLPIEHDRVYVLDDALRRVPVGAVGELHVAGPGLAHGYLGRPAASARALVPDPFSGIAGARMYRTGDRVRVRPDGLLEFLGRVDGQVKVRGFRVELGEIERVLGALPGVGDAAVVVVGGEEAADRRLSAFVVASADRSPDPRALLAELRQQLPAHLVPASVQVLPALPRTVAGKVDRRGLPSASKAADAGKGLRTPTEQCVAAALEQTLGPGVAVHRGAHFFECGGTSLTAVQWSARAGRMLGVEVPVRWIFESPTVSALATRIDEESRHERAPRTPLRATGRGAPLRASPAQEQLWLLDRRGRGTTSYLVPLLARLSGPLDVDALRAALDAVIAAHEVLRTRYVLEDATLLQHIDAAGPCPFTVAEVASPEELNRCVRAFSERPIDLARQWPLRAALFELGDGEAALLVVVHHIAFDAASTVPFAEALSVAYAGAVAGRPACLPALEVQVADVAAWQRAHGDDRVAAEDRAYWVQRLALPLPRLALPVDRPRQPARPSVAERVEHELAVGALAALDVLAKATGSTRFMVGLAAYAGWLARVTGQQDLLVGTAISQRDEPAMLPLVGPLINTLCMRFEVRAAASFASVVEQSRAASVEAFSHRRLPFLEVTKALAERGHHDRDRVVETVFAFSDEAPASLQLHGLRAATLDEVPGGAPQLELDMSLVVRDGRLRLVLSGDTAVFAAETLRSLARSAGAFFDAALVSPAARVGDLPLLEPRDEAAALARGEGPPASGELGIMARIAARCAQAPRALAVVEGTRSVDYGTLWELAMRTAGALRAAGVGAESVVALVGDRSIAAVAGMLGILASGGAFFPLDPGLPEPRRRQRLEEVAPRAAVVTDAKWRSLLTGFAGPVIDASAPGGLALPEAAPRHPLAAAYLIDTSGTSGSPKSVVIADASISQHAALFAAEMQLTEADRVLQFSALTFDASVEEILSALVAGAALYPRPAGAAPSIAQMEGFLVDNGITVASIPTSYWHAWTRDLGARDGRVPPSLRLLVVGGEAASVTAFEAWRRVAGSDLPWINCYGPTEATCGITVFHGPAASIDGRMPIGQPLPDAEAHVLDEQLRAVPDGVEGELYLGGIRLARGYRQRPALTAECFVPHPWRWGERLYRSGDRARRRSDGSLELAGRRDGQLKLRGFRVEAGEVEAALRLAADVADAAVGMRGEGEAARLVAWVVPRLGAKVAPEALRVHLSQVLPAYMVPSAYVLLPRLPLTASSKIDFRALPDPQLEPAASDPPRTALEWLVAAAYAEVLELGACSRDTDFFAAGGHSLLAVQLCAHLGRVAGIDPPLQWIFDAPTVSAFAARLEMCAAATEASGPPLGLAQRVPRDGDLVASSAQARLWFLEQLRPGTAAYHVSLLLRVAGPLDVPALEAAVTALVERHEVLRTRYAFQSSTGAVLQVVDAPTRVPLASLGADVDLRAWAAEPFDLARDWPLRVAVAPPLGAEHRVVLVFHHIACDGASVDIACRDLAALYATARGRRTGALPALAAQVADAAAREAELAAGPLAETELAYWREALAAPLPRLQLPLDAARSGDGHGPVRTRRLRFADDAGALLDALATGTGCTRFMVGVAAVTAWLAEVTGQPALVLGAPVSGRDAAALRQCVGMFVNTLALRFEVTDAGTFRGLLARVRRVVLGALQHRRMPFERVVQAVAAGRDATRDPVFEAMFAFHEAPPTEVRLDGAGPVVVEELDGGSAKRDLVVNLRMSDGQLIGHLDVDGALFGDATTDRLARSLEEALPRLLRAPEAPWGLPRPAEPGARTETATATRPAAVTAPPDALERLLSLLWCEVLALPAVAPGDDFFLLGGHSLNAVRVVARVTDLLGVEVPVRALFDAPTLRGFAARVAALGDAQALAQVAEMVLQVAGVDGDADGGSA